MAAAEAGTDQSGGRHILRFLYAAETIRGRGRDQSGRQRQRAKFLHTKGEVVSHLKASRGQDQRQRPRAEAAARLMAAGAGYVEFYPKIFITFPKFFITNSGKPGADTLVFDRRIFPLTVESFHR